MNQKILFQIIRKDPLIRKSLSLMKQIPRFLSHLNDRNPKISIMANSFPKSGTHLLIQILEAFPNIKNYDSFIATVPPIRFKERSQKTLLRRISWIAPGELVSAHLYYHPIYHETLQKKQVIHYFIYRDPRDVVISDAYFLSHMHRYHRAHKYFAHKLKNINERILCAIVGIPPHEVKYSYPSVAKRFLPYLAWINEEDVFAVKFEDLISTNRNKTIISMIDFFIDHSEQSIDKEKLLNKILDNIDPQKSPTFRAGKSGIWKELFTEDHKEAIKKVAGDILIQLGYEKDFNW